MLLRADGSPVPQRWEVGELGVRREVGLAVVAVELAAVLIGIALHPQ